MLLVVTNSGDATANFLVPVLAQANVDLARLDTDLVVSTSRISYCNGLAEIELDGQVIQMTDVKNVWYRRPEPLNKSNFRNNVEAAYTLEEWKEALDATLAHVPISCWMNHPSQNAQASQKLLQLSVATELGMSVPKTLVTQNPSEALEFADSCQGRVIAKPMATAYVERGPAELDSHIYSNLMAEEDFARIEDVRNCPTMFQQYIEKSADIRVTVVDDDFHCVQMLAKDYGVQRTDIRRKNMEDVEYRSISLPSQIRNLAKKLMQHFKLRFGAIDFVRNANGEFIFLEINPNGQWAWLDLVAKTSIAESFVRSFREHQ